MCVWTNATYLCLGGVRWNGPHIKMALRIHASQDDGDFDFNSKRNLMDGPVDMFCE